MDQEFAIGLIMDHFAEEDTPGWNYVLEGEASGYKRMRGWYQIWENDGQYWRIGYYTSYDNGIDEDTISFRQVERKEKVVVYYD